MKLWRVKVLLPKEPRTMFQYYRVYFVLAKVAKDAEKILRRRRGLEKDHVILGVKEADSPVVQSETFRYEASEAS